MPKNTQSEQFVRTIHGQPSIWGSEQSLIPVIWTIGQFQTGKSTFVDMLDPVRPGEKTRTLITDMEGSHAFNQQQIPIEVADIRQMTIAKYGFGYSFKNLFEVWRDYVTSIQPGQYTVLGVDPASDLYTGCFQWVKDNAKYFSKYEGSYNGKDGTKFAWGDAKLLWKQIITQLTGIFQTVVLVSHTKDVYSGETKTGDLAARGQDFTEVATLVLWLAREVKDGQARFWAKVEKSRLTHFVWSEEDTEPRLAQMLPIRLEPKPNQSYKSLIMEYIHAPKPDYGELNTISGYDPSVILMSEEEKAARELELMNARREVLIVERKNEIVNNLVKNHGYADRSEVGRTIHQLGLGDDAQDLIKLDEVEQRLIDHKSELQEA